MVILVVLDSDDFKQILNIGCLMFSKIDKIFINTTCYKKLKLHKSITQKKCFHSNRNEHISVFIFTLDTINIIDIQVLRKLN